MKHIGNKLKELSQKSGLKQKEIASQLNVTAQYLHKIFAKDHIDTKQLFKFAEIFNVPITYFFVDSDYSTLNQDEMLALNDLRNDYLFMKAKSKEFSKTLYLIEMILSEIKNNDGLQVGEIKKKVGDVLEFIKLSSDTLNQLQGGLSPSIYETSDLVKVIDSIIKNSQIKMIYPTNDENE